MHDRGFGRIFPRLVAAHLMALALVLPGSAEAQAIRTPDFPIGRSVDVPRALFFSAPEVEPPVLVPPELGGSEAVLGGVLKGLFLGAALGAAVGAIVSPEGACDWVCTREERAVVGAAIGGSIGAAGGLLLGLIRD